MIRTLLPRKQLQSILLASGVCVFAIVLMKYPDESFQASLRGLKIWWEVVFPALLPFFITAEILMGFGVVHLLGVLLEPLMRPLFRVPGAGAFVMAVGLISGNPMGAKLTTRLREDKLISKAEAERLVSFTTTAGPLFIFGAVSVGFFENSSLGILLAIAHYGSAIIVGICMRFYQKNAPMTPRLDRRRANIVIRALRAMHHARLNDGRPIGQLLGEAVTSAVQTLLMIGGFIIVFSVLVHLLTFIGITTFLTHLLGFLFSLFQLPDSLHHPFIAGIFEMTIGSQVISETSIPIPLLIKLSVVSFFIGWNGLSIHAQVASLLSRTDISYKPYFFAKILHGTLACAATWLLYIPMQPWLQDQPTVAPAFSWTRHLPIQDGPWTFWHYFSLFFIIFWVYKLYKKTRRL
ncbi:sporulation integral membrane protein YlbJ [Croceifilum oryzae]|uniref:Sporulation integral membrane protein YlbJ n=1 Tax=Croceifilum oryzae TaxID=1553429 RepID=A0AAJ1WQB5_9BACL|nr:sporulation integral membrane protein YlbJ [Croceifilum oryzae]MDQ0417372.1 sporulation integral membrane protein YlbJ [Croceifilum oryzae]